ncbi:MAG: hypothetical protein AAGB22_08100, partial [Bacteroidota bacterium]
MAGSMLCCLTASAQEMWGIRNLNLNYNDTVYTNLNAAYYASGAVWNRFQQTPGAPYDWTSLDRVIDSTVNAFGGELVLLLDIAGSWAVDTGAGDQPPLDLDRSLDLAAAVPDSGYSPTLFTFVRDLMAHLDAVYSGTVWLRFSNEPQFNWAEGHTLEQNDSVISDYIRCLRTVYRAAHDTTGISDSLLAKVSHGGIYVDFWQKYHWYLLGGNGGIRVQDSVVTLFQSRYNERTIQDYTDWYDVVSKVRESGEKARRNWVLRLVAQTAWMDYWDVHYHFKPRF